MKGFKLSKDDGFKTTKELDKLLLHVVVKNRLQMNNRQVCKMETNIL